MKTNFTRSCAKKLMICVALLATLNGFSQPEYVFKNSVLLSGASKQIGAKYRFSDVKPGVDGILTITDIQKVILDNIDGPSGFDEAFQPIITIPKKSKGYVEFQVDFVKKGTLIPAIMKEVPMTAIDIDGYIYPDEKVYELDEFIITPSYYLNYDLIGSSLSISYKSGWVQVINKTATDYPGVDTVQRDVMFSMVYANISSISFRVGGDNKSKNDAQRLRSVYFKKFIFPNSAILAQPGTMNFRGKKDRNTITLNWVFASNNNINNYTLERAMNGGGFVPVSSASSNEASSKSYSYVDMTTDGNTYTYRLKVTSTKGNSYYSQIILFKNDKGNAKAEMTIFPAALQNGASVTINSSEPVQTSLYLVDYSGRRVYSSPVLLTKGANSFYLDVAGKLAKGNYVAVIAMNGTLIRQKVVVL